MPFKLRKRLKLHLVNLFSSVFKYNFRLSFKKGCGKNIFFNSVFALKQQKHG
jgi:hypothetical protein